MRRLFACFVDGFRTTSRLKSKYLGNKTRYRQREITFLNYTIGLLYFYKFGELWPTNS